MRALTRLMPALLPGMLLLWTAGCGDKGESGSQESGDSQPIVDTFEPAVDADGDGMTEADGDCNDTDAGVFRGQAESCDGLDNNCNGLIDEGLPDVDVDGTPDCSDSEDCDGIDNTGEGTIDEGFPDSDGNGVPDCRSTEVCDGVDNNADGTVDEGFDADDDGYTSCGSAEVAADCNDNNAAVNPGAPENDSNGVDDDCDGTIDTQTWAEGDLLITEVMFNPQAVIDPYGEWIELYNTTRRTITLNGLTFSSSDGASFRILSSDALTIAPGAYFVLATSDDTAANGLVEADYVYTGLSLSNEGDDLALYADSTLVQYIAWDAVAANASVGASYMVDPGHYGETDQAYWCAATSPWGFDPGGDKGSPGLTNELCATYDHDGDGYSGAQGDCDDDDDTVYPGAFEVDPTKDNDCDGVVEWGPVAAASATSTGYACDTLALSSTGSYDPDGSALNYAWRLDSAPASSAKTTTDINTTSSAAPSFYPDVPGTYVFSLTVNDGGTNSLPVSVSVTVVNRGTNATPVPYAGADQAGSGTADCQPISYGAGGYDCDDCASSTYTLSATGSTDGDNDEMSYAWAVTSGSTYGSLSGTSGSSVTLTVAAVTATYGSPNNQTVTVQLTATDCMGASATDTVDIVYGCTGY